MSLLNSLNDFRKAAWVGVLRTVRNKLPILAYLLLTLAIAWAINGVHQESQDRREQLAQSAQVVVRNACERDNTTREALVAILEQGERSAIRNAEERNASEAEMERIKDFYDLAFTKLKLADCDEAVRTIKVR